MVLTSEPAGDVTVTVSGHDETDLSIASAGLSADDELTFTTANWGTAQTVTVKAAEDADAVTDADVTLTHAISSTDDSTYDALADQSITVSITENDAIGVTISPTTLTVAEGDATGLSYTVVLTSQPAGDVTVAISGHASTDLTLSGTTLSGDNELTFTTANWGTAQTVTVKAAEDEDAVTDADVTLTHAISSTDDSVYNALADQSITVSITENDAIGVTISPTTLTVAEGDATGVSYTVVLTSEPAGDVTVTISGHDETDLSIASAGLSADDELTFTTENWGTAQTVTVKAAEDADAVTDADVTLTHAISSTDDSTYDALADQSVTVSITEDDAVGVTIDPTTLTVAEGDATGVNYTVVLTSEPAGDVTVTVSGHSGTDLTLSGTGLSNDALTFTTTTWETAQTVTVTAAEDADAVTDADVTLVHAISSTDDSTYNALADQRVTVSITENDAVGPAVTVSFEKEVHYTIEGASGVAGVEVLLSAPLQSEVTIPITVLSQSTAAPEDYVVTDSAGYASDPGLTFSPGETFGYIFIKAVLDTIDEQTETVVLGFGTLPAGVSEGSPNRSTVEISDAIQVSFADSTYMVQEGGPGVEVMVRLNKPSNNLRVPLTADGHGGADESDFTGVPQELVFEHDETEETFIFMAIQDSEDETGEMVRLGFGAFSEGMVAVFPDSAMVMIADVDDDGPPTLKARRGDGEVHLEWVPVEVFPADPVRAYQLRYGAEGVEYGQWRDIPRSAPGGVNERSYTVTGLENGTRYAFELRVRRAQSGSGPAAEIRQTPEAPRWSVSTNRRSVHEGEDVTLSIATSNAVGFYSAPEALTLAVIGEIELDSLRTIKGADPEDYEIWVDGARVRGYMKDITFLNFNSDSEREPFAAQHFDVAVPAGSTALDVTVQVLADADEEEGQEHMSFMVFRGEELVNEHTWDETGVNIESGDAGVVKQLAVADAEATEGEDPSLDFVVTLAPAAAWTVTVDYATRDGTARAGSDYTATNGTLTFAPGDTAKTVSVPVIDDTVQDTPETLTLELSNADPPYYGDSENVVENVVWGSREAGVLIADAGATGTIRNTEDQATTPPDTLTASFPESQFASRQHTGSDDRPQVVVAFSEAVASFAGDTPSVLVTGGTIRSFQAHTEDGLSNAWIFFLSPEGNGDVTFTLAAGAACDNGGICTAGGTPLTDVPAGLTIRGPAADDGSNDGGATVTEEPGPLTASFADVPAAHDGSGSFSFELAFSEDVGISYATLRDDAFEVDEGGVTRARRVDGRHDLWEITVEPDGREAVSITLPGNRACGTTGAVCTAGENPRALSNSPSATVAGPTVAAPPTVSISGGSGTEGDDSAIAFAVTLDRAATDTVTVDYATSDGSAAAGGDYTATSGTLSFAAGTTSGTITVPIADDEVNESDETFTVALSNASGATLGTGTATGTIRNRHVTPLTASFEQVPAEHGGTTFVFHVRFSEDPAVSYRVLRDESFGVTGGKVVGARRKDGRDGLREIHVEPSGGGDVTVSLPPTAGCGAHGAVCTSDGRPLSNANSATVRAMAALSVADADTTEGAGATLDFAVSLDRASTLTVTVDYATSDGTATAGADYTATSGTLTFQPGDVAKTVSVPILDDLHDDDGETLTLTLSNASNARIADGTATGTIENSDPIPKAWLARFGRTVATHVTDAVGERLRGSPGQDSHLTVGGYRVPLNRGESGAARPGPDEPAAKADSAPAEAGVDGAAGRTTTVLEGVARVLGLGAGATGDRAGPVSRAGWDPWLDGPAGDPRLGRSQTMPALRLRDVLLGSSFRLSLGADDSDSSHPRLTAWGRVATTRFDGRDGTLSLDGDVLTGTVGVDGTWDRWLAGIAVAHSRGDGSFTDATPNMEDRGQGDLEQTLTSIHPYLRYAVTDELDVWGLLGYGWGELTLAQPGAASLETDTDFVMGAFGGRGILLAAPESGGFQLATRTDAMLTRITSEAVTGLASSAADAHRLRLILEGSRGFTWAEGRSLTPTMEVGLRHDWGDAETGFGVELGGRVQYADPALGLTIEGAVRGLLAHEDRDYQEWGASGSLRLDPGAAGRGLSLTLAPTWGAAQSGVDGLWSRQTTTGLAPSGRTPAQAGRLNAQVGYGLWLPSTGGLVTPFTGVSVTDGDGWRTRAGLLFVRPDTWGGGLRLELAGESSTTAMGQSAQTIGVQLQFTFGRGRRAAPETPGRGGTVRATPVRSPTAPDGVGPGSRIPTPRPPVTTGPHATAKPPGLARDRADGPRYFVQLGLFSNHADALRAKTDLAGDLRDLLHHRRLAVVRSTGTGRARVVYVQPFPTPDAAAVLCAAIQTHGPACAVTAAWPGPGRDPHERRVAAAHGGR